MVFSESNPVIIPGLAVFFQPARALEHTLGQDNIHIFYGMLYTPHIYDHHSSCVHQQIFEIYLMQHSLDIGHTDLERGVLSFRPQGLVQHFGILFGDQTLPVEADCCQLLDPLFHTVVFSHTASRAVIFYRDYLHIVILKCGVINYNDPMRFVNSNAIHPDAAGHQQAVISVEFAELALPDGQIHHDSFAN